jgi:hypothetical protein
MKPIVIVAAALLLGASALAAEKSGGSITPSHEAQDSSSGATNGALELSPRNVRRALQQAFAGHFLFDRSFDSPQRSAR